MTGKKLKIKKAPKVSVVICHFNGGEDIIMALESLKHQTYKNFETIISDNGSTDGSVEKIKKKYKWVKVHENRENLGFAKGNNIGINLAKGEIIFTINQDVILETDFIEKILRRYDKAEGDIAVIGGKMLRMDGKTIDSTGLQLTKTRRFMDRGGGKIDTGQYETEEEVFGICAAGAAYKKEALISIAEMTKDEIFDSRFFLLVEDVDIAWRLRHAGYKALYYPKAVCRHIRGGAGWKSRYKQYLSFRNRYYLLIKNEYLINIIISLPRFILYDIPRFTYMIFTNQLIWKGIWEVIKNFKFLLQDRRRILTQSVLTPKNLRKWLK
jgi:GT2 family glycosyltransferase